MRKLLGLSLFIFSFCAAFALAQSPGTISGQVLDASGAALRAATVTITNLTSGTVTHATTGADGRFVASNLSADRYLVTVEKSGFQSFNQVVSLSADQPLSVNAKLQVETLGQSVVVRGTVMPGARPMPTREEVALSDESTRVLDRKQLDAAGPVAGGAQMISYTPGANVIGYGNTGATKYTIQLNGIHQGWAGENTGFTAPGSLGITFDGVPVTDVATGLWQSATLPQNLLMQDVAVTYGPGSPDDRFYDNIGGQVEFTPIQPTVGMHMSVQASYGSFNQKNIAFVGNTGDFHGWSTVVGGGVGNGDSFRSAPDGFVNHAQDGAIFVKTIRMFSAGSFELGSYYAKAGGYRPQVIPLTDQGIIESGNGVHYSETTSGFYSTLPFDDYNKYDTNEIWNLYGRENLQLNPTTTLTNMTWYMHIRRFHRRLADQFAPAGQVDEWNNPYSDAFGDQVAISKVLPMNTVTAGAYYIHELYNAHNNFFDPALGGDGATATVNIGGKFRSGYFDQDDASVYVMDDFHPIAKLHITPGLRFVGFRTGYSDQAARDFNFAPGVVMSTHCAYYPANADPYLNLFGPPNATNQGSICGGHQGKGGVEPSVSAGYIATPWLTFYGGYSTEYHSPSLGGGGGQFQAVDPNYYLLAKGAYSQGGAKIHFQDAPALKNFIFGADYYHLDYTNQEIDFETAGLVEISAGGDSTYHGMNAYFDDDPLQNLHIFANFTTETSHFTTYVTGAPNTAACQQLIQSTPTGSAPPCAIYNNLPVAYVPNSTLNAGVYYGIMHNDRLIVEPRLWFDRMGSQHLFDNCGFIANVGCSQPGPSNTTMPSYTTTNVSFTGSPMKFVNLSISFQNIFNRKFNEYEYISSGGYFGTAANGGLTGANYILAYPGEPLSTYGTISFQF
ncbi:MAG TPA: TonB-dependent receptor [Candidatus Acidoferrales bacterium]|nr:TonB-dependent receptor [Candidatus Acidoferrales bacterium]